MPVASAHALRCIKLSASIRNKPSVSRFTSRLTTRTGAVSTVAALLVGVLFFKLGLWQLSRADEKTAIVQSHRAATELPPLEMLPANDVNSVLYPVSYTHLTLPTILLV